MVATWLRIISLPLVSHNTHANPRMTYRILSWEGCFQAYILEMFPSLPEVPQFVQLGFFFESCFSMPSTCSHSAWVHTMFLLTVKPSVCRSCRVLFGTTLTLSFCLTDRCLLVYGCVRVHVHAHVCMCSEYVWLSLDSWARSSMDLNPCTLHILANPQCRPLAPLGFPTYAICLGYWLFLLPVMSCTYLVQNHIQR